MARQNLNNCLQYYSKNYLMILYNADMAQLVERGIRNAEVRGSTPRISSKNKPTLSIKKTKGWVYLHYKRWILVLIVCLKIVSPFLPL